MSVEDGRFDGLLMNIAQTQHGIEPLLDTVFSFLRRKTDFFTGASPAVIEDTILKCVRKQAALADQDRIKKQQHEEEKKRKQREKQEAERAAAALKKQKESVAAEAPRFEEVTDEEAEKIQAKEATIEEGEANEEEKKESEKVGKDDEDDDSPRKCCVDIERCVGACQLITATVHVSRLSSAGRERRQDGQVHVDADAAGGAGQLCRAGRHEVAPSGCRDHCDEAQGGVARRRAVC